MLRDLSVLRGSTTGTSSSRCCPGGYTGKGRTASRIILWTWNITRVTQGFWGRGGKGDSMSSPLKMVHQTDSKLLYLYHYYAIFFKFATLHPMTESGVYVT